MLVLGYQGCIVKNRKDAKSKRKALFCEYLNPNERKVAEGSDSFSSFQIHVNVSISKYIYTVFF